MHDFFPHTRQDALVEPELIIQQECNLRPAYVGPSNQKPKHPVEEFDSSVDIKKGMFLLVRPPDSCPTWLAYAEEDPIEDPSLPHYEEVFCSWWEPVNKKDIPYPQNHIDCWEKRWRPNPKDLP
jgi:hypothetical protein